jgi:A/G-specific adenine glycosylase
LPWRRDRDPYRIWVSEVMLQQTQVATVVPYFERFVRAFPTVADLAAADEQEVLGLWEGLGYYRRARDLHAAAQTLMAERNGRIPNDPDALNSLPGMGRYTLGAVLSQAFDRRLPIVEANSQRVLCRLFGQRDDPSRAPTRRWLWRTAETLLPRRRVGEFNQALMELGALVCLAAAPRCSLCPLSADCAAHRLGMQGKIPIRRKRKEIIEVHEVAVVVRRGARVLLVRRTDVGRWPGLWEFPHGPVAPHETPAEAAARLARQLAGVTVEPGRELLNLQHGLTHHRITLSCLEARYLRGPFRSRCYQRGAWPRPEQLQNYPLSSPQRRLARAVERSVG